MGQTGENSTPDAPFAKLQPISTAQKKHSYSDAVLLKWLISTFLVTFVLLANTRITRGAVAREYRQFARFRGIV